MADTTITITIAEAQFPTLQNALATKIGKDSPDATDIKTYVINNLKQSVKVYDSKNRVATSGDGTTTTVTHSTFTPS